MRGISILGAALALVVVSANSLFSSEGVFGGKQGKNIVASPSGDGDTVQVVYGQSSGNPDNPWRLWYALSLDGGANWTYSSGSLSPSVRNLNPGIVQNGDCVPYLAWQEARFDGVNYVRSPLYFAYDQFFPYGLFTPMIVAWDTNHYWFPSIAISPGGDTVLISAADKVRQGATNNAYLFCLGGDPILMIDTQNSPYQNLDPPRMVLGSNGYIFALFNWTVDPSGASELIPYYTESLDWGSNWSPPQPVFPDTLPYVGASGCYHGFDCVLVDDLPHCAIKLGLAGSQFGDVWEVHPTSGSPGGWSGWTPTLLAGEGQGEPWATYPSIGRDPWGSLHVVYEKRFASGSDTLPDMGYRFSSDDGTSWSGELRISNDSLLEERVELADNVNNYLHIVYQREPFAYMRYPNPVVGVEEDIGHQRRVSCVLRNHPNPFLTATEVEYSIAEPVRVELSVYDVTGKQVKKLIDKEQAPGRHIALWDGTDSLGQPVRSGVYFYRLTVQGNGVRAPGPTGKMVVVR